MIFVKTTLIPIYDSLTLKTLGWIIFDCFHWVSLKAKKTNILKSFGCQKRESIQMPMKLSFNKDDEMTMCCNENVMLMK
jgi:hypothetical protein